MADKKETFNFETDRSIDPDALDTEWLDQPNIFFKYASRLAKANQVLNYQEELIKTIRSELIKELNKEHGKMTGAIIEANYRTNDEYKDAKARSIELEYERDMLQVAVDAINYHKKAALENLVRLGLADYFAMPKEPKDLGREREKKDKREVADERIMKTMGRKRKNKGVNNGKKK